ncbi:preprotein translocase subunit SecG [Blastopirellula marina]|uniref:Protein-export membrane protein SecG n=1 Tax=Blastopirellula marina TaxID=124 RepID=A0A2S8GCN2_9BACT|nr:preprotein translocase subunit SecG [Blastopirellula marina]PQO42207.1 preprotein translocase subunit SecG [Blastopirellula marina]
MTSPLLFAAAPLQYIFGPLILLTSVFLILVVLVQRGRGGGLTGALGGAGGQSAFGAKAGDVFTKITVVVASFWILLCILATMSLQDQGAKKLSGAGTSGTTPPAATTPDMTLPSDESEPASDENEPATSAPAEQPATTSEPPAATTEAPAEGASSPAPEAATPPAGEEAPKQ